MTLSQGIVFDMQGLIPPCRTATDDWSRVVYRAIEREPGDSLDTNVCCTNHDRKGHARTNTENH